MTPALNGALARRSALICRARPVLTSARPPQTIRRETMFGKAKPSPGNDPLAERIRRAVEGPTARPPASHPLTRQIERAVRQAIFRHGALILAGGEKLPVALKNISATGARVEYFTRRELPEAVILVEPTLRIKSRARVVWQRDGVAGLAFVD